MSSRKPRQTRTVRRKNQMARDLRARSTDAECVAWKILRNRQILGLKFRRQYPLFGFIVDFYNKPERLVIEIDGTVHENPEVADYDRWRESILKARGVTVARIRNEHVSLPNLLSTVTAALGR